MFHQAGEVGPAEWEDRFRGKLVQDSFLSVVGGALELIELAGRLGQFLVAVSGESLDHVLHLLDDDDHFVGKQADLAQYLIFPLGRDRS